MINGQTKGLFPELGVPRFSRRPPNQELIITDTTLRDGQQGSRPFTVEEALSIYNLLVKLDNGSGVIRDIELFPYTTKDREVISKILDRDEYPRPIGWVRSTINDLRLVKESGLDTTIVLTSVSDYHIYYKLGMERSSAEAKYLRAIEEGLKMGLNLKVAMEDITRCDVYGFLMPFLNKVLRLAERYRAEITFKLSDTLGLGLPFIEAPLPRSIPRLIKLLLDDLGLDSMNLEFHGHNDFHLVIANHLAAWVYGASLSNCTLLGIGERAGNCPLEAMALFHAQMREGSPLNLRVLSEVREFFKRMGFTIPEFYPILGENAFRTKAGIHIDGLLKNPAIYLPFDPEEILGIPYTVEITPYSGRAGLIYWIVNKLHFENWQQLKEDKRLEEAYKEVLEMFKDGRTQPLSDHEVLRIIKKHLPELVEGIKIWE